MIYHLLIWGVLVRLVLLKTWILSSELLLDQGFISLALLDKQESHPGRSNDGQQC